MQLKGTLSVRCYVFLALHQKIQIRTKLFDFLLEFARPARRAYSLTTLSNLFSFLTDTVVESINCE